MRFKINPQIVFKSACSEKNVTANLNFSEKEPIKIEPGLDVYDHQVGILSTHAASENCSLKSEPADPLDCDDKENFSFEEDIKSLHTNIDVDSQELTADLVGCAKTNTFGCLTNPTIKLEPNETSEKPSEANHWNAS